VPEILCLSHQGVRCGMPPRRVVGAEKSTSGVKAVLLWRNSGSHETQPPKPHDRVFLVTTAGGPHWIHGSNPKLHSVSSAKVSGLSPLLRDLVPLLHIVGMAEIEGDLVWLVDPTRFRPQPADINNTAAVAV
jgi:hypothetical protein